jgi:membrane protein required for colicin V production
MTNVDYVVVAIVAGSAVVGMMRGLITELLSLCSWMLAGWCAKKYSPLALEFVPHAIQGNGIRLACAFVLVFVLVWVLTSLLRTALTTMVDSIGLGAVNHFFGAAFGLARGLLLVLILTLLGGLTNWPQQPSWRNAALVPALEAGVLASRHWLPAILADKIHYPDNG